MPLGPFASRSAMTLPDWIVIISYLAGMLGLSWWLSRGQKDEADYYVGGRTLPWWALALSTMATQSSANSFLGIPAFVALAPGGGLTWLQYELALPFAMILLMLFLVPVFRGLHLISVYEYLERRFDRGTRLLLSAVFLLSRGLATGVAVYAAALVLQVCTGLSLAWCIVLMGGITVVYDTLGGMKAVVWSDVIQMLVLFAGIFVCGVTAVNIAGGWDAAIAAHAPERLAGLELGHGIGDGARTPFWGFMVGGLVLYLSYYGVDQSQVQRQLAAPSVRDAKRTLVFNGVARFPLTLLYAALGLAVGAVFHLSPDLRAAVPEGRLDYLVPRFIELFLPPGIRGLLVAAILAAAMSSLDSALNSLSAATLRDFVLPRLKSPRVLLASRLVTLLWGALITGFAFWVGDISTTVVEGINRLGAFFYGPLLAAFAAGVIDRRARGPGVVAGVVIGVGVNVWLLFQFGGQLFWMWWNITGLVSAIVVTAGVSRLLAPPRAVQLEGTTITRAALADSWRRNRTTYAGLFFYGLALIAFAAWCGVRR
ncbi:MAG: sodium transporter [Opitutus sp.]|nr:sodium transporter [Opitutus sp.]